MSTIPDSLLVCFLISPLVLKAYTKQKPNSWTRTFQSVRVSFKTQHCLLSFLLILNSFHKDQYFMLDRIQMILPSKIT